MYGDLPSFTEFILLLVLIEFNVYSFESPYKGCQGLTNRVRGVLENSKFSYLRTPYIYLYFIRARSSLIIPLSS